MDQIEQQEGIKITFKDFILKYLKYLPLFIISAVIGLLVAYIYLRYATPLYNATATLLIKSEKNPYGAPNEEFESIFLYKGGNDVDNEIEVLKSRNLAKRVARVLELNKLYYAVGNVKVSLAYPDQPFKIEAIKIYDTTTTAVLDITLVSGNQYRVGKSNEVHQTNQAFKTSEGEFKLIKNDTFFSELKNKEYRVTISSDDDAASFILGGLKVDPIKDRASVLLLSYQGIQPDLGKDILNHLMEEYKQSSIEDKNQIAIQTSNFIDKRLAIIGNELGDVEKNLQTFKQKNQVINASAQSELALNNQSDLQKDFAQRDIQLNIIKYLQEYIVDNSNKYSIVPSSLGIEDPVFLQAAKLYNELQLKREAELRTTTASNPVVVALGAQADKLRADMKEDLRNLYYSTKMLRDQEQKKMDAFQSSLNNIPLQEKNLLDITRQQGIKQSLYLYLLQKREETAISLASTISNSQVVDVAIGSRIPIKPDPTGIKIVALFLGLLIPVIIIYLRELFNDKIRARQDISKSTQAPIFGEIAHSDEPDALVMTKNSRKVISEQFRMIRTNLNYLVGNKEKPVILVTSTVSGEGKSFISINAGAVMALAGKRTVILEFDIRKPKIISGLKLPKSPGITNYLVGDQSLESLVAPVPGVQNLFVIPCGPIPPNPAEILLEEKLADIFSFAKEQFDMIIVDTAPVGLVSDAQVLSRFADCTFYITRLNYTLKKHVHFINDIYINQKLPKMGLLVNDISASSDYYSYGNYNGYGYGYGYGYSYFDESEKHAGNWLRKLFVKGRRNKSGLSS